MFKFYPILKDRIYRFLVDHHPRIIIERNWIKQYGYKPDWNNPRDLNEKIQWLICYGDTSLWPLLADKYRVRNYVTDKGLGHLLPELYGVYSDARDIDFNSLPERFVLKCNHDSGSTFIINKTQNFDKESIIQELDSKLKNKFGYRYCEPHYNRISPVIIAQEYLESKEDSYSSLLVDYRVWCFNGKPYSIWVDYYTEEYKFTHKKYICLYDLKWNYHPENEHFSDLYQDGKDRIPRPKCLPEMLLAAQKLAEGLPEARIDFYIIDGKLYFGEITLTSNRGRISHFTKDYLKELGDQIHLPK